MTATSRETPARPVLLILVAGLAAFTANLDLSIVNLALPAVGRAFGTTQSELAWTVNADRVRRARALRPLSRPSG